MLNFGFQGDFDLFRSRGQVGAVLSIDVPSETPEIGTVCPITFRTLGVIAWASTPPSPWSSACVVRG